MAATFNQISGDLTNRGQSWTYTGVWTYDSDEEYTRQKGSVRVEIRKNAYRDQSHARISAWSIANGWLFHTSIPTEKWYDDAPSYVRKRNEITPDQLATFGWVESDLISRYAIAVVGTNDFDTNEIALSELVA